MDNNPQRRLGLLMTLAMWVVILGLVTLFFKPLVERQYNPNPDPDQSVGVDGSGVKTRELVLDRNRWGHYVAGGSINGLQVVFMLDTGASDVAVPLNVAKRLGLKRGPEMTYQTANGAVRVYATTLDNVSLGGISLNHVRASINPHMEGDEVLMGMSFLKHLEFSQKGDSLTLRQSVPASRH